MIPAAMHESLLLAATAASIGFVHTLLGPDHYLPFIALARARGWSPARTAAVTLACGAGHVAGSVVLGLAAVALGLAASRLAAIERVRGDLAAWLLVATGAVYLAWGLRRALRGEAHRHAHRHRGPLHDLAHRHGWGAGGHTHEGEGGGEPGAGAGATRLGADGGAPAGGLTPWVLFLVFVLGPCEPLIPLLLVAGAAGSPGAVAGVTAVFAASTLATMVAAVLLGRAGLALLPARRLERFGHAAAGAAILACGLGIGLLGL
jgi:hypothetical protein